MMTSTIRPRTLSIAALLGVAAFASSVACDQAGGDQTAGGGSEAMTTGEAMATSGATTTSGSAVPDDTDDASTGGASTTDGGGAEETGSSTGEGDAPTSEAFVPDAPSCANLETSCADDSCCSSVWMHSGTYQRGCTGNQADGCGSIQQPEHEVQMDAFALDKYMVTVGRYREFLSAIDAGWSPSVGDGAHPNHPSTGWRADWFSSFGASELQCSAGAEYESTYTEEPGMNEDKPMNCVSWYDALAFCAWDGGRLATGAEWEYVASGAGLEQPYPWGFQEPTEERLGHVPLEEDPPPFWQHAVGSTPAGNGVFGHADLIPHEELVYDCWDDDYAIYEGPAGQVSSPMYFPDEGCASDGAVGGPAVTARGVVATNAHLFTPRSYNRDLTAMGRGYISRGFRCARDSM